MVFLKQEQNGWSHHEAVINGVRLHYVEAGKGPLVVLLHGFPEFWYSWRFQIPALAHAGFRVVAVDMRGYNTSEKPRGVLSYTLDLLSRDVQGLIDFLGERRARVAGHDWGAAVAWDFAMRYPDFLEKLVILNVPHPMRFLSGIYTLRQLRKSWYIFFFQLPWLPEAGIRANNFAGLRKIFRTDPVRSNAFTEEDIERYMEAISQPGALTAGINYYRALFRQNPFRVQANMQRIDAPVLVIWGEKDRYLGSELTEPDHKWVPNVEVKRIPEASHWVQLDAPERVNEWMIDFLRKA